MARTTFFIFFDAESVTDTLGLSANDLTPRLAYNVDQFRPLPPGTQLSILTIRFQVALNEYSPEQDAHYVYCTPNKQLTNEEKEEVLRVAPDWGWLDMQNSLPF